MERSRRNSREDACLANSRSEFNLWHHICTPSPPHVIAKHRAMNKALTEPGQILPNPLLSTPKNRRETFLEGWESEKEIQKERKPGGGGRKWHLKGCQLYISQLAFPQFLASQQYTDTALEFFYFLVLNLVEKVRSSFSFTFFLFFLFRLSLVWGHTQQVLRVPI